MPRRPLLAEQVADAIAADVRSGERAPGSWLPAWDELAREHGVGRATARRVIHVLAERGLVDVIPGRGAKVVADPPIQSLEDRVADLECQFAQAPTREEVDELKMRLDVLYRDAGLDESASSAAPRRRRASGS